MGHTGWETGRPIYKSGSGTGRAVTQRNPVSRVGGGEVVTISATEMAQKVKEPAAKPDNLNSTPGHTWQKERTDSCQPFTNSNTFHGTHV